MASVAFIQRQILVYVGLFVLIVGLIGSVMQVVTLTTISYYRKTPCTFFFIIAGVHECGQFIASIGPLVIAACLDIDTAHLSVAWCKLRYFFTSSFSAIPLTCACFATIDQFLITSQHVRLRQWSTIKNAYRASLSITIIWWLHGTLWLYFQDMSPITGVCFCRSDVFRAYAVFFFCIALGGIHILIMMVFGILSYRNIRKTIVLSRLRVDRQMTIIVFMQALLALIGLLPYDIFNTYAIVTMNVEKNDDRTAKEALVSSITFLFGSLPYGGRFYLFMFFSPRFRRMVKDRFLRWPRSQRIVPLAT